MKKTWENYLGNTVGVLLMYDLIYSDSFVKSLEEIIYNWEIELGFSEEKIKVFIQSIEHSLRMVSEFPKMHEEVSDIYSLSSPTYRILIGKQYAIFYRLNSKDKEILVGSIFNQKQMRINF